MEARKWHSHGMSAYSTELGYIGITMIQSFCENVFVKHGCPRRQQSQTMAKISKTYILILLQLQGHVMSVKCEQPLDELTVQVWLLCDHPNFKYCTLFISWTELRTDGLTNGQTDDPNNRCPRRTFQAGDIKITKFKVLRFSFIYENKRPKLVLHREPECHQ